MLVCTKTVQNHITTIKNITICLGDTKVYITMYDNVNMVGH